MDKVRFNKLFGDFVRFKRASLGLTQIDLADRLGNNYQNISRLERGEVSPTFFWIYSLAEAFEVEIVTFVAEFDKYSKKKQ